MTGRPGSETSAARPVPSASGLRLRAQATLAQRRAREEYLPRPMFGEVAWEIMLHLFIHGSEGAVSIATIADWVRVPPSTATRWVRYLEEEGLVDDRGQDHAAGNEALRLTSKGRAALDGLLSA